MYTDKEYLDIAAEMANNISTCKKVAVGSCFVQSNTGSIFCTANRSDKINCKELGECRKFKLSGIYESREETRHLCAATHSEINMINLLKRDNVSLSDGTLYVTRYPCLNCANELVKNGIMKLVYGGVQRISEQVEEIFIKNDVECSWIPECDYEFDK